MDELIEAQRILSQYVGHAIKNEQISQESVVLSPDELDKEMLAPFIVNTLPNWVVIDMFAWDAGELSYMLYFIRPSDGIGEPIMKGLVKNNADILWTEMIN